MAKQGEVIFDPDDASRVRTTQAGVYRIWEDISGTVRMFQLPFLSKGRALVDITTVKLGAAFVPAISLWYTGQLLRMVERAVETRTVDREALFRIATGRILVPLAQRLLTEASHRLFGRIRKSLERYYSIKAFRTMCRVDVPTFTDAGFKATFGGLGRGGGYTETTWSIFAGLVDAVASLVQLISSSSVLVSVFKGHSEAAFFFASNVTRIIIDSFGSSGSLRNIGIFAWKSTDEDFVHLQGLKKMVQSATYRKDIVAGGIGDDLLEQYERCLDSIGDEVEANPNSVVYGSRVGWIATVSDYMRDPVDALGQVYTCLKVANSPSSAPFSLATLQLINESVSGLHSRLLKLGTQINGLADRIDKMAAFYQLLDCPNKVQDGTIPFPENQLDLSTSGISVEFRNVSFKYAAEGEIFALKNVTFKIKQGQLCVIVGENGSGKSTILNLINRIYDVTEGEILVNGLDIRTVKLADLRRAIAVLDQSYSIFPLTLAQNIGYGDPRNLTNMAMIQHAALVFSSASVKLAKDLTGDEAVQQSVLEKNERRIQRAREGIKQARSSN